MESSLLNVNDLTKIYGGGLFHKEQTVALEHFTLGISDDRPVITTIAGESGSGKTTLANLVLGFLTPTSGEILYQGKDIWHVSKQDWIEYRRDVQGIFQDPYGTYNPFYKVDFVFDMVISKFKLASSKAEARRVTEDALEVVGLRPDEILGKFPHQLSGGQRQRIMVARAFLLKPRLIVADEPVSMIDASLQVRILDILLRLKNDFGISFLYITHDLSTAYQISDDIYILYLGSVMEKGSIDAVMQDPQHPYTQLLLRSIPVPDPDEPWEERLELPPEGEIALYGKGGCKYYSRCPFAMDVCQKSPPALEELSEGHWVACYLRGSHAT
jgi:oligopeptide/dipeptide ABC transporter ATP-binding protein